MSDTVHEDIVIMAQEKYVAKLIEILDDPDFIEEQRGFAPILITRDRYFATQSDESIARLTKVLHKITALIIGVTND